MIRLIASYCVVIINSWHITSQSWLTARSVVDQHQITVMAAPPPPYEKCQTQGLAPVTISSAMFPSPSFGREPVTTVCRNCHSNVNFDNQCWRSFNWLVVVDNMLWTKKVVWLVVNNVLMFRSPRWWPQRPGPWPGYLLEFSASSPAAVWPGSLSSYQTSG